MEKSRIWLNRTPRVLWPRAYYYAPTGFTYGNPLSDSYVISWRVHPIIQWPAGCNPLIYQPIKDELAYLQPYRQIVLKKFTAEAKHQQILEHVLKKKPKEDEGMDRQIDVQIDVQIDRKRWEEQEWKLKEPDESGGIAKRVKQSCIYLVDESHSTHNTQTLLVTLLMGCIYKLHQKKTTYATQICGLKKSDSNTLYQFDCMTDTDTQTDNSPNSAQKTPSKGKSISKSKPQKGNKKQQNEDSPKKQNEDPPKQNEMRPKKAKAKKVVNKAVPRENELEERKKESKRTEESVESVEKKESKRVRRRRQDQLVGGEEMSLVREYMQKQNRPYNILNVFDNLHGKVKKPLLESILTALTEQGELTCKQFGKNKVYYPNQKNIDANVDHINQLSQHFTTLKDQEKELGDRHKRLAQDSKKLLSKKTIQEIESLIEQTTISIAVLKQKISRVGTSGNMDEKVVATAENRQAMLRKELGKRRKLVKELIDQWSEHLQQKRDAVALLMGVDL